MPPPEVDLREARLELTRRTGQRRGGGLAQVGQGEFFQADLAAQNPSPSLIGSANKPGGAECETCNCGDT